ncbi:MAG: XRE family transcriptional regulator [Planctomycetales bacterium]|nr:XRE family transcriptional regulator [Planctomycetales bacterium]
MVRIHGSAALERPEFNPDMLRVARGALGETQGKLAEALGVTQGQVSRWEDGLRVPSAQEVEKLAQHLQFPVAFFFQADVLYGFGTCCMYHRKRQSLPIGTLNMIHDRINIMRMGIGRLLKNSQAILPEQFVRMDRDDYESPAKIAALLRATWQMPHGPVKCLVEWVERAGGIVVPFRFGTKKLDAVSQWPRGMPPLFFVNTESPADRWRFSLAHEVGHIVMHATPSPDAETEADEFASEFLMPEREVRADLHEITVAKGLRLKHKWRVSMQALIRRAKDLGVITQSKYTSLFAYLSKLGYRTREPADIAPEEPTTLSALLNHHTAALGYSRTELAEMTFCSVQRFQSFYLNEHESSGPFRIVE